MKKDDRYECPVCYVKVSKDTVECPVCGIGIPKGSNHPQTQSKTSFNPGGDKGCASDITYHGEKLDYEN